MNIQDRAIIIGIREPLVGQRLQFESAAPKVGAALKQGKAPVAEGTPSSPKPYFEAILSAHTEMSTRRIWYEKFLPK
jgi:hypothetical protein